MSLQILRLLQLVTAVPAAEVVTVTTNSDEMLLLHPFSGVFPGQPG